MGALFGSARPKGRAARSSGADERRQLTVLFYDIVGSTAMLERLDPEDTREILLRVHDIARECISDHFGSLQQVLGDGGMAYFGWPAASEDAVFQSVSAAWAILRARDELAGSGPGAPDIRIGIATSVVVLPTDRGASLGAHLGAVGVAPNLAARLETVANPNSAVVDATTERLCRRAFEFRRIDGLDLKGFPDVRSAWSLTGRRDVTSRYHMLREAGTPLVAREAEARHLWHGWEGARSGNASAVLVEGEAGIGKSRLAEALVARIGDAGRVLTLQCQPSTSGEALYSLIGMYERAWADWDADPLLGQAAMDTANLVRELEEDPTLSATARRRAIVEGCVAVILNMAERRPCLVLAEDLHWADEVTLAVLSALAEADGPVMVLGTARPDTVPFELRRRFQGLTLQRLSDAEVLTLATAVADSDLSRATLDWIVEKSDGNPLFATELAAFARDLLGDDEKTSDMLQAGAVVSLRDILAARLDMAGRARRTAQIASVIGRDVPFPPLLRLTEDKFPRDELEADLDRLVQHGIHHLAGDGVTYSFHHALVRDAAYESQLRGTRRDLHGQIVDLVMSDPELGTTIARESLAEHCLLAGRLEQGIDLLIDAAELALSRSAFAAPRTMLERALTLADGITNRNRRREVKLRAIMLLGPLVTHLDGPRAAEGIYARGQDLCFELPEGRRGEWFPILWGWWFTASDLNEQARRSEVLISDVSSAEAPEARLQALHCGWATLFDLGDHDRSLAAVREGLALYDPVEAERSRHRYGHDAKVCGLGERAQSLWMLGDVEASRDAITAAEDWGNATGHVPSILHALDMATLAAFYRRDQDDLTRILGRVAGMAEADDMPVVAAKRQIFEGWIAARGGNTRAGAQVTAGLETLRDLGALEDTPVYADIAADTAVHCGDPTGALPALDAEIANVRDTRLLFWLPELLRRRAVLGGAGGDAIAGYLDEGLEVALGQNAHMLVLRNVVARLDLGLSVDARVRDLMGERIGLIGRSPSRDRVIDALGL